MHDKAPKTAKPIGVKVREDHIKILSDFCRRNRVSMATFIREAALELVKGGLGIGVEATFDTLPDDSEPKAHRPAVIPVKFTEKQRAAILAHCLRHGIAPGTFLREAALRRTGNDPYAAKKK